MSHYMILGLVSQASAQEIKTAYRNKARITHPDKGGSDALFHAVQTAYEVLSDPEKRREYDREISATFVEDPVQFAGNSWKRLIENTLSF